MTFETVNKNGKSPEDLLKTALLFAKAQLKNESDFIANLSNLSAIIGAYMEDINWAGFYLMKEGELVLGPFQGNPACNRIQVGEGVCGTAVKDRSTQRVDDVLALENHIACDSASRSELVIPLVKDDVVYGVLDIDSPSLQRFGPLEQKYMEELVRMLMNSFA